MDHRTDLVATCRSSKVATGKVSAFGMAGNDGVAGNFRAAIFDAGPRGWGLHTQPYIDTHSHGHARYTSSIHVCMQHRCQTYQTYQTSNPSPCHALQYIQVGEALAFIGEKVWLCFFLEGTSLRMGNWTFYSLRKIDSTAPQESKIRNQSRFCRCEVAEASVCCSSSWVWSMELLGCRWGGSVPNQMRIGKIKNQECVEIEIGRWKDIL